LALPLTTMEEVQGFELMAYPMMMTGSYVVLEVAPIATLNTATGVASEPYDCLGRDPMVCDAGVRRDGCAGALVKEEQLDKCRVHTKVPTQHYYPISSGDGVLLVANNRTVRERCPVVRTEQERCR
jgi:hypothetical protein